MASPKFTMTCGFCNTLFEAPIIGHTHDKDNKYESFIFLQCGSCKHGNMIAVRLKSHNRTFYELISSTSSNIKDQVYVDWKWPNNKIIIPNGLPEKVEIVYKQAEQTFKAAVWEAASERYRKAIEQACKDKGQTSGNLVSKIKMLHDSGQLTKDLNDWAHEIRIVGNGAAHDDPLPDREAKKEAEDMRAFCELFMTYIYSLPKKLSERRDRKGNDK